MKKWHYPFLAFLLIGSIIILSKSKKAAFVSLGGR